MAWLSRHIIPAVVVALMTMAAAALGTPRALAQRKVTPVNTPQTATQPINEFKDDTARINARMRASMKHYHDENGNVIYIDTITGKEWRDSTAMKMRKPMQYPLLTSATVGVDIWNPLMRAFGQHYGLIDFMAQVSLHNRYKPTFETGLGLAHNTPADNNFTYRSPLSIYFRLGIDYNFLYNSTPDYQYFVGLRYGFSTFSYTVDDITIASGYWDEAAHLSLPTQHPTVGWMEFVTGLRVQLWGPISAGWTFRFHTILHDSKSEYGQPWYIPGYGARGTTISGSMTITYTLPLNKKLPPAVNPTAPEIYLPEPEITDPYAPGVGDASSMQEQAR